MKITPFLHRLTRRVGSTSIASHSSLFVATCLLIPLTVSTASANLISNGSFESPVGAVGFNSGRPTDWTGFGGFVSGVINGSLANRPSPQDGNQFVDIGRGEMIHAFTVVTPGDYLLTWFDNTITSGNNGSYGVRVQDSSLATVSFTAYSYNYSGAAWHARSLNLSGLTAGTYSLTYGPGTTATYLDNVVLDTVAVPEPSTSLAAILAVMMSVGTLARSMRKGRLQKGCSAA